MKVIRPPLCHIPTFALCVAVAVAAAFLLTYPVARFGSSVFVLHLTSVVVASDFVDSVVEATIAPPAAPWVVVSALVGTHSGVTGVLLST